MDLNELKSCFGDLYGDTEGTAAYFSPGRVNLIGEHTDYNGGHVFPCALTIGTYAVARKRTDDIIRLYSANIPKKGVVELKKDGIAYSDDYGWANYPIGVIWALQKRGLTFDSGFEMVLWGDIPNGSGLSSSASLEVLTGVVARDLFGFDSLTNTDLALIGQYSENEFNGMNCCIMDQFAVAMGKKDNAIFLDTSDLSYEYAPVALPDAKIVIVNSKVKHSLVDSAYNKRREESAQALKELQTVVKIDSLGDLDDATFDRYASVIRDDTIRKRAKHAVYENQRTIEAVADLKAGKIAAFGKLINASHVSLRDDYAVSCEECDCLAELAWSVKGCLGARITGGGFGGCTVNIVENDAIEAFEATITEGYEKKFNITPDIYVVSIGEGARKLS